MRKLRVAFRVDRLNNEVTAVLPDLDATEGTFACTDRLCNESECSQSWYYKARPATPKEYAPLLRRLRIEYAAYGKNAVKLRVVRRIVRRV